MKKFYFLLLLSVLTCQEIFASHTKGGWMYYEYLGPGTTNPAKLKYKIGFYQYMVCNPNSGQVNDPISFSIFNGSFPYALLQTVSVNINTNVNTQNCISPTCYPCINFVPNICYKVINYETTVELDATPRGYIISYQRCCRIVGLSNLTPPSDAIGATYMISIPGTVAAIPNAHTNSSPKFIFNDTAVVCANGPFSIDFKAIDPNNDSLVYSFCDALTGGTQVDTSPDPSSPPPFTTVSYQAPFSGTTPLGAAASINPATGNISGIAPAAGEYVLSVCVAEYRNGIHFADSRKELHLKVADCFSVHTSLGPDFVTCGDLTFTFQNLLDNPSISSWMWTFGDPSTGSNDTSYLQHPTHTFSAAGMYNVKLLVNKDLPCKDSTTQRLSVYPGFFPGFRPNAPFCVGQPVSFSDTTRTNYGTVTGWHWDFGDPSTLADTSNLQNPSYSYANPGTYTVKLVVGNTKGCRDSTARTVTVNANPIVSALPTDTIYCALDSIPLRVSGTGSFAWTPNANIIGANTNNPLVFPPAPRTYYVTLTDNNSCRAIDSVHVTPLNDLVNNAVASPNNICQEDTITLTGSSNHASNVKWQWSPAISVESPANKVTRAFPSANTSYTLTTTWGDHCVATKTVNVIVTPLAIPNAGPDTAICAGQGSVQLSASGGVTYAWSPAAGLSNPSIANPIANPTVTTKYAVAVGVTGCSKTRTDSVLVKVRSKPNLAVTNDTLICSIDTLQLNAVGAGNVVWTPNYMINNTTSHTPLVSPDVPTLYHLRLTDSYNCYREDSVFVDVKQSVTIDAGPDTSICKGEGYSLRTTGDALSYTWDPVQFLSNPNIKNPFASPPVTTTYKVIGNIGKCQTISDVTIKVAPYPLAEAGPADTVCLGFNTQLFATGGSSYTWLPTTYLSNPNIANPVVINPGRTITYTVTVTDTLGCTKAIKDSVKILVIPRLNVDAGPSDTSVVDGQSLQLNASGAFTYLWSPNRWLNSISSPRPVSTPQDSITYYVTGTDIYGCSGTDSIHVNFFTLESSMYVPTAFTPNHDGLNDVARPIMIGMRELTYFRIYNRFGELVFQTSEIGKGWDGVYKGKPQDMGTFVWMAQGLTYKGEVKTKKGNLVLIR